MIFTAQRLSCGASEASDRLERQVMRFINKEELMTGNEDLTVQFGEDPPWDDLPPVDREKANKELECGQRILHPTSGLYCEHGHGPCKSALEVASFLGGYSRAVGELINLNIF